ncbi:hypothetical protein [Bacteroides mediterraneensis]|uniref:Uncharacterized protein n=1 Tax=Bacteroides mediterraneensis TaxID=1841856 RepID=A0ABS2EUM2_9BACE|nr:hypothetical protein [Bacteroides mediterraneensis]MBM6757980.1 hypothetical protein [Bacteroides mediterraneensis]MBM6780071.1 hypothetical protein [Bacteroides mediterraneensis]
MGKKINKEISFLSARQEIIGSKGDFLPSYEENHDNPLAKKHQPHYIETI